MSDNEELNLNLWITTYKCRLCGEQFEGGQTTGEDVVLMMRVSIATNKTHHSGNPVLRIDSHHCADGNIGFGDIIGIIKTRP